MCLKHTQLHIHYIHIYIFYPSNHTIMYYVVTKSRTYCPLTHSLKFLLGAELRQIKKAACEAKHHAVTQDSETLMVTFKLLIQGFKASAHTSLVHWLYITHL